MPGVYAQFVTSEGNFTVRLYDQEAPKTVENFIGLAEGTKEWMDPRTNQKVKQPYYNGVIFHRVIKGFMIQGGDPLTKDAKNESRWGTGDPGYKIDAEFNKKSHERGVLSMARSQDPNSAGSVALAFARRNSAARSSQS